MSLLAEQVIDRHRDWQKQLIYEGKYYAGKPKEQVEQVKKGVAHRQQELAIAVEGGTESARDYLLNSLGLKAITDAKVDVPELVCELTPGEMSALPRHVEEQLGMAWDESVSPAMAAESAFWAVCHAKWMSEGKFGNDLPRVFLLGGQAKTAEARTRNFLRRTGGLPRVRGNVSVFSDCQISGGLWRYRIARDIAADTAIKGDPIGREAAHDVLRIPGVWNRFAMWLLRSLTPLNAISAKAAVVMTLHRHQDEVRDVGGEKAVKGVMEKLGRLSHTHHLDSTPWEMLLETARSGLAKNPESAFRDETRPGEG